jgi:hypothetical protein
MTGTFKTFARLLAASVLTLGTTACSRDISAATAVNTADASPLHDAVKQVNDVIVYDIFSPPQASRVYAYASIATYEVLRHGETRCYPRSGSDGAAAVPPMAP